MERRLAVALHDVEPVTFERCALIRDWLADHGVDRVTLLVIRSPDMHTFDRRGPELAGWLAERRAAGDAVAQQGLCGRRFSRLDERETRHHVDAGRRLLRRFSPVRRRLSGADGGELLRLDIHPADLEGGRNVAALESILQGARDRVAVTYDAL